MLIVLPGGLLVATLILMQVLRKREVGRGLIWSVAAFGSNAAILSSLFLFRAAPLDVAIKVQASSLYSRLPLHLTLDHTAWVFQTTLLAILGAVLLTATRRQATSGPDAWFGSIGFALLGLFAVQAGSLPSLLTAWFLIDLFDLVVQLVSVKPHHDMGKLATSFALRYAGILLAAVSILRSDDPATIKVDIYILLAVMLRLGTLPFWSYWGDLRELTGMGTMMLAVRVGTALLPLTRLEPGTIPAAWTGFFTVYCLLLMLYCAMRWLRMDASVDGRVYWFTGYSLVASVCVVHDLAGIGSVWAVAALLGGSSLFLLTDRSRLPLILSLAALLALTGLPFTPVAEGWLGMLDSPIDWRATPFILAHVLYLSGFIRHAINIPEPPQKSSPLARFAYPAGLSILLIMPWLLMVISGVESPFTDWWAGFITFGLMLVVIIVFRGWMFEGEGFSLPPNRFWQTTGSMALRIDAALRQDWLVNLIRRMTDIIARITRSITNVLEGDGGFLWVLLLLALFITAIAGGQAK